MLSLMSDDGMARHRVARWDSRTVLTGLPDESGEMDSTG
jgi:hypothetical protein